MGDVDRLPHDDLGHGLVLRRVGAAAAETAVGLGVGARDRGGVEHCRA